MRNLSRRVLLQESLLAAAAMSAPLPLLAADEPKPSKSPNEKLSIAVIGIKSRGGDHAKFFDGRDDCHLSYICDVDTAIGEKAATRFKSKPKFVQDLRRVM